MQGSVLFQSAHCGAKALQLARSSLKVPCSRDDEQATRYVSLDHSQSPYDACRTVFVRNLPFGSCINEEF